MNPEIYPLAMHSIRDYAVFLISPEGIVETWNIGAELMKQYKAEEIIGQHYSVLFTPEDQKNGRAEKELEETKNKGLFEEEHERMRKDGTFFKANISLTALRDKNNELIGFVKVTRDMTDRVIAEKKLMDSQEELSRALAARDEFLSIASHELKTPLTALKLQCEMFVKKFKQGQSLGTEAYEKFSRNTSNLVNKLNRLVDDMLDISRIQYSRLTLHKEKMSLCDCLKDVVQNLQPVFNMAESDLPEIEHCQEIEAFFDRLRLEQVFNNILTNAIRYGEGKPVRVRVDVNNQLALIKIQDQGVGIPKEKIDKLFDRFERAKNKKAVDGLGLGLFITKQIVEAHSGKIWVESEEGKGSTFFIHLPCFNDVVNHNEDYQVNYLKEIHPEAKTEH